MSYTCRGRRTPFQQVEQRRQKLKVWGSAYRKATKHLRQVTALCSKRDQEIAQRFGMMWLSRQSWLRQL